MNRRMVCSVLGKMVLAEAILLLLPFAVSLIYGERCATSFLVTILLAATIGLALIALFPPRDRVIYAKEGFVIVALSWIAVSAIGALPFYFSREIPAYVDAFFETVSGFTTTGASILTNVEAMSHGLLFWRSFTHWIGGMGVLVFVMAILPNATDRSIHIMRAEMAGPIVGKLVPRVKDTAKILYVIYIALTAIETVFLLCGGMSLFESLVHAFGTAGTGGFGIRADSIGSYSPYVQWVITIFMLIFGVNFNLYYLILIRRARTAVKSVELWVYLGIVAVSIAVITANILPMYGGVGDSLRHAAFQVSSLVTTTGYGTTDFNLWPELSKVILVTLMFIGGCAGSTAGGFKVSRVVILFQQLRTELRRMLHPRAVRVVRFEHKRIDDQTIAGVNTYLSIFVICFFAILLLISINGFDFETTFTATAACFNNIGPGLGGVGPASSFAAFSGFSKVVLSVAMLLGRLEIFPLLLALSPATWIKK